MFNSFKKLYILIVPIIVAIGLGIIILFDSGVFSNRTKHSSIVIDEKGNMSVVNLIKVDMSKELHNNIKIPLDFYEEEFSVSKSEIKVYLDGREISKTRYYPREEDNTVFTLDRQDSELTLYNLTPGVHSIELNYICSTKDVVEQFNNLTLIKLCANDGFFKEAKVKLSLFNNTSIFETDSKKANIIDIGNNTYEIDVTKTRSSEKQKYVQVRLENGTIKNANIIEKNLNTTEIDTKFANDKDEHIIYLVVLSILSVLIFIITSILTRKCKASKEYTRNPEAVIEPIIAESIIDRKIGAKELIMSCIVELIYRGNLKNIGNDGVEIVHLKGISKYEEELINLIFGDKNSILFDEIKDFFIKDNEKTKMFYIKFKNIKKKIEDKIFDYNIYSKAGKIALKIIKAISLWMMINIIFLLKEVLNITMDDKNIYEFVSDSFKFNLIGMAIIGIIIYLRKREYFLQERYDIKGSRRNLLTYALWLLSISIVLIFFKFQNHIFMILGIAVIFILNIMTLRKTKLQCFTSMGRIEYSKAYGLKKYIEDYSLMEQRNLDSVIIWDEYLAYAVAFGIPNKIANKFEENLMELNIILQKIDNFLD